MQKQRISEQRRQLQKTAGILNEHFLGFGNFHQVNEMGMTAMGEDASGPNKGEYNILGRDFQYVSVHVDPESPKTVIVTFERDSDTEGLELKVDVDKYNQVDSGEVVLDTFENDNREGSSLTPEEINTINQDKNLLRVITHEVK
jgi:hypothetical protein